MASQMTSQSSSSSNSSGSLEQHQPSFDQQRASGSSHGSSADQPGPSGLQGGPSTSQDDNSIGFPSQELSDFDMMVREEGASTHQYPTGRRDPGARSGHLSDDHREAEVPHTETSHTEVSSSADDDAVVPSQPISQQSQPKSIEPGKVVFNGDSSDVSQSSLKVPSLNDPSLTDSTSVISDQDCTVPRKVKKKIRLDVPGKVGVDFSPPMYSNSSGSSNSDGSQYQQQCHRSSLDIDTATSDSSVDPASTSSTGGSGSSSSQDGDTSSSGQRGVNLASSLKWKRPRHTDVVADDEPSTSQSLSMLNFSQPEESSYHIPATPDSVELPSISSDVISSTPDTDTDGPSQELISSTPDRQAARYKRERSYDGDDDASSLDEVTPKRQKLSPVVTSASTSTSATSSPSAIEKEFKTPSRPPMLKRSKSGSSSGGSSGGSLSSIVTSSSSGSTTLYPSSGSTSSGGVGHLGSSQSSSDVDNIHQVETTPVLAVQTTPQMETSKEDIKDVSANSQDTTMELSQDATVSLDMIGETVPQSFPADDDFNLHLSNTTTATECSALSQELEESQVESQSAATTSSSSSSEQTVEDTPTPDDHVTSPSPSPDDNDDGTAGGRGSDSREPENDQDEMEENNKKQEDTRKDDEKSGGNGEQQEESGENSCIIVVDNEDQQEENSCIIVEALLSSEPAHQSEGTTSSQFELGMAAPSRGHQVTLDSPIKAPKVTVEFSQDSFPSLSILTSSENDGLPPIHPISTMRPSSLLENVRAIISTDNTSDPFEFPSQDENEVTARKKAPKPPSNIPTTQADHLKVKDDDNDNGIVTGVSEKQSLIPTVDKQPLVVEKPSFLIDDHSSVVDSQPLIADKQPPVEKQSPREDRPVMEEHSPVADAQLPVADAQLPVADAQLPVADEQPPVGKQSPEEDELIEEHSPVIDVQSPAADKQLPVGKQLPEEDKLIEEHSPVMDAQLPGADEQPPVGKQSPEEDKLIEEHSPVMNVQLPLGKRSPEEDKLMKENSPVMDVQSLVVDRQLPVTQHLLIVDEHSPVCSQSAPADNQLPVTDNQISVTDNQSPVIDKQLPVTDMQLSGVDNQTSTTNHHSTEEKLTDEQSLEGDKQSLIANANVMGISCDHSHDKLPLHSDNDEEMEYLPLGVGYTGDITPSEHGQVVDRSSEDPLNSTSSRSEIASTAESSPRIFSEVVHSQERHSRTTIYTTKTVIIKKRFIEEQMVNDQWMTTDEYQEELDPVVEESEETIMKCVKSYPPKTIPFQDTSISSSFSTPKTPQRTSVRRCSSSNERSQRISVALSNSQDRLVTPSHPRDRPLDSQDRLITPSRPRDRPLDSQDRLVTPSRPRDRPLDSQDRLVTPSRPQDRPSSSQDRSVTPSGSQDRVRRTEDDSPTITQDSSSSRIGLVTPQLEVLECSDNRVLARWKDGQWYPGTIQDNLNNGKSVIVFDDGDKKVLAKSSVVQMSLLRIGSEVMVLTENDDYLRGSITGRCTVDDEAGYLINTGGREPLRCPESDLKLTQTLVKQLTSAGPSPSTSPAVRSKRNLVTTPSSSKKRRTNSSPTVSTSGSSMLFYELSFLITGEGKSSRSLGYQIVASGGILMSDFPTDVCPSKTFLIADKPRRTAKYLLALAGGVPCVQPVWAKDCLKQNRLLDYNEYLLPAGKCSKTNRMIPWSPREPKTILKSRILLKGNNSFKEFWEPIIMASGGKLVSRLSYSGDDCDLVLCQGGISGEGLRRAQNLQLPCVDVEWAIQSLIAGEQLDHNSFACT